MNSHENLPFFRLYFGLMIHPSKYFPQLLINDHKLRYGLQAFLIPSLGYTLFYVMAWKAGGAPSAFKPWLAIPMEEYFKYGILLALPGYFISWITAAGTVHLLSRAFGSRSDFNNTLVVLGFGIGIVTWSSLAHDLIDAFLALTGVIQMSEYERMLNEPTFWRYLLFTLYIIYFIWFIALFFKGLRNVHRLKAGHLYLMSVTGLIVFQSVLLIFIR